MNRSMQYFKPNDAQLFVGDCMPFSHSGRFSFFYLLDQNHHRGLGGLGGHQWALATSRNLTDWAHHPLAIPISADWEGSICTGSVLFHDGRYYGFYATRRKDSTQHLSLAVSQDGLNFEKTDPNPFYSPPAGYSPFHFRDPFAFCDPSGQFHLLVTACLESPTLTGRGGCLAHLCSSDLKTWTMEEPFLIPGTPDVPECPDLFHWGGWYYLLFSSGLTAHYRMSRSWKGPWQHPGIDTFETAAARVMKTAAWKGRRIGVAWIGERAKDGSGEFLWGGQAVFRELFQRVDGTLGVKFVPEMAPSLGERVHLPGLSLERRGGLEMAQVSGIPVNVHLRMHLSSLDGAGPAGLRLRAGDGFESGVELLFHFAEGTVRLGDQELRACVLDRQDVSLEINLCGSIVDICINQEYCLITRITDRSGTAMSFFALDAALDVTDLEVWPLDGWDEQLLNEEL